MMEECQPCIELRLLSPEVVALSWNVLEPPITKALRTGQAESTSLDYLKKALNQKAQIWAVVDGTTLLGVGVTQFLQYSQHKTLHIVAYAGEGWKQWKSLLHIVEKFAKDNGAIALEQWGRPGWSRTLSKEIPGFETVYHVMRKKL